MTQEQINQLFKQRYNRIDWKHFLTETFNKTQLFASPEHLTGIDNNVASEALKLGYVHLDQDGVDRQIAVFEVVLAKGIILERNRVGLRNLLKKYWKNLDAAFIVYYNPDSNKWRFTYVAELTEFDAEGSIKKVQTEPKRYTYVLGEGESTRTASERFHLLAKKGSKATLDDVKDAFSVEKLSKTFFDEYKKLYEGLCEFMLGVPKIKKGIFNEDEKAVRDFNKKFLGRIVFLYFLQKKGWLGVPPKEKYGKGDIHFLQKQFENFRNKDLFYKDFLTILFFETLNTHREGDLFNYDNRQFLSDNSQVKIPFLSGGLFDEDDIKQREITIPSNIMANVFAFFNQYNFTIYEDDPNDHTVAVDPEMLGHIFENLLEDNKDKGAFYTPKEIVHFMCQESLIEYLCTTLQVPDEKKERIAIENLLKNKIIDPILKSELKNISNALDTVKICDPAIGSGAFPMGLLQEIFMVKQTLWNFEHGNLIDFPSSVVKRNIIQNSIYGVDIEKGAVDIARLRFWLSLVVDEQEPKALPNLDYKIVVGNSLVSKLGDDIIDIDWTLNETSHGLFGADLAKQKGDLLKKISKEQKEFFNPDSDKKKLAADIRKLKIDLLITQLELMISTKGIEKQPTGSGATIAKQTEIYLQTLGWKNSIKDLQKLKNKPELPLHFFDWKLDFPEVLNPVIADKYGFDIVIGNPPYVRQERLGQELKEILKKRFPSVANGTADLYVYFFSIGLELLTKKGVLSYITLNKYLKTKYGLELRNVLANEYDVNLIIDFFELPVFEASTDTSITTIVNSKENLETRYFPVKTLTNLNLFELTSGIYQKVVKDATEWKFIDHSQESILDKLYRNSISLKEFSKDKIYSGIKTALNEAYVLSSDIAEKLLKSESKKIVKPYAQSTDIKKWGLLDDNRFFLATGYDIDVKKEYPSAFKYLSQFETALKNRQDKGRNWWNLRACKYYGDFEKPKIIYMHTAKKHEFFLDTEGCYINNSCYMIVSDSRYLFAFLNSNLFEWIKKIKFVAYGDAAESGRAKLDYNKMITVPIKNANKKEQNVFDKLVNQILTLKEKGKDTTALEQEIDNLVYKLYELTYDEVKVIDPEFSLSKKEYEQLKIE